MAVFNAAKREIDIKIVYYGPALCGKTTNVQSVHEKLAPEQRGDIMSLATKDDRTLFFDFLPIELGNVKGFKTRFHLYTVPGQVYYALTRRAVLTGVDGVVFVADSQKEKMNENIESLNDLDDNLKYHNKGLEKVPFIIQYNKRDLDNILSVDKLDSALNTLRVPWIEACAKDGTGVVETLTACCKLVLKQMNKKTSMKGQAQKVTPSPYEEEPAADEPFIKITQEEPVEVAEVHEPAVEALAIDDFSQPPTEEPLSFDESPVTDIPETEINMDSSLEPLNLEETTVSVGEGPEDEAFSLQLEPDGVAEPEISLEEFSVETPLVERPSAEIQEESDAGLKVVSCGQPEKVSDIAVKVPIVLKVDSMGKECTVNISIKFDDFTLKG